MCDKDNNQGLVEGWDLTRRSFVAGAVAVAGMAGTAFAADGGVVEKDVMVKTPDGTADSALFYPAGKGRWPAVLIWTDILGLRPVFREMGKRLAAQGYVVLVPNPFYRAMKAPVVSGSFDFNNPADRAKMGDFRKGMSDEGSDRDAIAFAAFLDAQPQTNKKKKMGVQGYCMGGPLTFRTAAAVPGRIGAVGSFHGGGLVSAMPNSPHLLIPKTHATYAVCVAQNDDMRDPKAKDVLKQSFADAKLTATVEVYPADHGWCVADGQAYNKAAAEKAWGVLTVLYKSKLV